MIQTPAPAGRGGSSAHIFVARRSDFLNHDSLVGLRRQDRPRAIFPSRVTVLSRKETAYVTVTVEEKSAGEKDFPDRQRDQRCHLAEPGRDRKGSAAFSFLCGQAAYVAPRSIQVWRGFMLMGDSLETWMPVADALVWVIPCAHSMKEVSSGNFGLLIAFVLPGFIVL